MVPTNAATQDVVTTGLMWLKKDDDFFLMVFILGILYFILRFLFV
jgi:hypothetical protein